MADGRKASYDILRILACFLVIANHTNNIFWKCFPSLTGWLSLIYFFISKISVPIFFMLTGALLLNRQEPYSILFRKRILRIFIALFIFSLIVYQLNSPQESNFFIEFFTNKIAVPYWYLYTYLGLLFCLPLLRKMVAFFTLNDYKYFIICFIIFTGFLQTATFLKILPLIATDFSIPLIAAPIGYTIIGNFINSNISRFNRPKLIIYSSIGLILSALLPTIITANEFFTTGKFLLNLDSYQSLFSMVGAISAFCLISYFTPENRISVKAKKILYSISSSTLGIYLIHVIIIAKCAFVYQFFCQKTNNLLAMLLYEFFIFAIGYITTRVLQKIPFIRRII